MKAAEKQNIQEDAKVEESLSEFKRRIKDKGAKKCKEQTICYFDRKLKESKIKFEEEKGEANIMQEYANYV